MASIGIFVNQASCFFEQSHGTSKTVDDFCGDWGYAHNYQLSSVIVRLHLWCFWISKENKPAAYIRSACQTYGRSVRTSAQSRRFQVDLLIDWVVSSIPTTVQLQRNERLRFLSRYSANTRILHNRCASDSATIQRGQRQSAYIDHQATIRCLHGTRSMVRTRLAVIPTQPAKLTIAA